MPIVYGTLILNPFLALGKIANLAVIAAGSDGSNTMVQYHCIAAIVTYRIWRLR